MRASDFLNCLRIVDGRPTVRGECDLSSAGEIEAWLESFDTPSLDVDLSGVSFIDSSGLKAFLNVRKRNANMRVVEPSSVVLRLLQLTGTHGFLIDGKGTVRRSADGWWHPRGATSQRPGPLRPAPVRSMRGDAETPGARRHPS